MMKGTDHFKRTIQMFLEQRAAEDELFAKSYRNPAKNIDDCVTYILNYVQKSGLAPETSLALAEQLISHPLVLERLQKAADLLNTGYAFSDALKESGLFGGMEIRLIIVAFQSGTADDAFADLSSRYQDNASALITRVISVIEPTIVIILSVLVGLVLLSVMMPLLGVLADIAM